mgnify:CR=1 FL=1
MMKFLFRFMALYVFFTMNSSVEAKSFISQPGDSSLVKLVYYMKHAMLFNKANPQEKVYLHFDNTGYFKGETMFFKAYSIRTDTGKPSNISKVLYVELLNPSGDIVEKRKIKMENGVGHGDFKLDSIFGTGFYEVRAFTRYMINWGGACAFSRVFPIYKKPKKDGDYFHPQVDELSYIKRLPDGRQSYDQGDNPATRAKKRGTSYSVTFYPEGGDMVEGLESTVAYSVVDGESKHAKVMGMLLDPQGNEVLTTGTELDGRGSFQLKPTNGIYKLVLTTDEGKRMEFSLPEAKPQGCVMHMNTLDEDLSCVIRASREMQGDLLGYTIMNRGEVLLYDTLTALPALEIDFSRDELKPGVNQMTLFNADGQILAERLFFICPEKSTSDSIYVTTTSTDLKPCSKVNVTLKSEPLSKLSFSAMDAATLTDGKVGNAQTWMLLASDVKGYIENPDYFFEDDDETHRKAADMLMLTQGWRRYDWKLYSGVKPFSEIDGYAGHLQPIEDGLYIHGQLMKDTNRWRRKHPVGGAEVDVFLYNSQGLHYDGMMTTDSMGYYAFRINDDLEGEWNLQFKTKYNDKAAAYHVAVDRNFSPEPRFLSPYETQPIELPEQLQLAKNETMDSEKNDSLVRKNGIYVIPTVKIKKRYFTDNSELPWYDEATGANKSTVYYNMDEATDMVEDSGETLPTLYEWLLKKNDFFSGEDYLTEMCKPDSSKGYILERMTGDVPEDGNYMDIVYKGGPTYKNRPIIWIVNNMYVTISHYTKSTFSYDLKEGKGWSNNQSGAATMPDYIDEVKAVYISENDDAYHSFINGVDELDGLHPVTVFVYTHPESLFKEKGTRRTFYQGFNVPETFKMEDYGVMPPMEDFRRTLFWEPDITTNEQGYANIMFYNNSSCKKIYFSVEGMTPEGRTVVNE